MKHRHHAQKKAHKAKGGAVFYAGGGSHVAKEAEEKKHGGAVKKHVGKMDGHKGKHRLDKRPRRAHGGRVGADKTPFSSAARPAENTEAAKP